VHLDRPDPFHPASDPAAYVPRPAFERALRELELCLRGGSLVAALLGPPGIGKTLLLRVLAERLEEEFKVVYLPYPHTAARELCRWALIELGEKPGTDAEGVLLKVAARYTGPGGLEEDRTALVLLLDDADALPLGSARRLYELAREAAGGLRLVLTGADAQRLERTLSMMADDLPVLRLDEPMSAEETSEYVLSRLELVEADSATRALFTEETLGTLHELSRGIPAVLHEHAMAVLTGQGLPDALLPPAPSETSWEAVVVEAERERRDVASSGAPAPAAAESAPAAAEAPRPRASTLLRGVEEAEARAAAQRRRPRSDRRIGRWLVAALALAALVVLGRAVPPWLGAKLARTSAPPPPVQPEPPAPAPAEAPVAPEQPMPVLEIPLPEQPPAQEVPVPLEAETPLQGASPSPAEAEPPERAAQAESADPAPTAVPEPEPPAPEAPEAPTAAPAPAPAPEAPEAPAAAPAPAPVDDFAPIADALAPLREELARRGALPPPKPAPAPGEPGSTVAGARIAVRVTAPEGAVIEIDGRRAGTAPLEGVSLPPGSYRFVARLPDGRVMQRTVSVAEGAGEVVFP
jgi:type II secretory pathway predicted ATPase ExeA